MLPPDPSRRSFLRRSVAFAGAAVLPNGLLGGESTDTAGPLVAYVGTFSSPLRDVLKTQAASTSFTWIAPRGR
jgi:6-phosphogluconolactonase